MEPQIPWLDYGRHSETERVLVNNEGLAIQSLLKIQSGPLGNLRDPPFDGDEMNMHMPQNILAETELRHLAAIPYQVISPASNSPIIGIFQDSLLGSYRMTRPNVNFTPRDAMNLLMMFSRVDTAAIREKAEIQNRLSSFDVLTQIMPPLTLVYKTKLFGDAEDYKISNNVLEIRNGKYVRGQLEKSVLGSTTKGILHRVCNDFGYMPCADFNDDLQNIVTEYMKSSSYSVGISDLIADRKTQEEIIKVIHTQKSEVQSLIDKVHLGIFENTTANTSIVEFENSVNNILNKATEQSGKIGRTSLSPDNRFLMIVNSGSKGSLINISQMISCLGQQNVDGKRIPYGFNSRTLPHYHKFDDSPTARGFIENSYISGLTAPELFFHAMGGRIGLIDTAVKTSQTGYIQRRLIKGLEDLKVEYDMTVRNSKGKIIQFAYGDDGFDSTKVENQVVPLVGMSVEDIYMMYDIIGVNDNDDESLLSLYTKPTVSRVKRQKKEAMGRCKKAIENTLDARESIVNSVFHYKNENTIRIPVAFQNIIANIQGQLGLNVNSAVDITPLEAFEMIEDNLQNMNRMTFVPLTELFITIYRFYLNPKELLVNKRFNRKALTLLLETVSLKHKEAIVHPGEMVGVIAGQSIGEPTTQLTLNSVTYETPIVVRDQNGVITKISIGDFTQREVDRSMKIDYIKDKDTTYAELSEFYEIPSANESGETVWRRIEAVTQHPVVNLDGTNTMLKIITDGNREVIATKAKSFLQLRDGKILDVAGSDLNVGDYLPASRKALEYTEINTLDLREILPVTEYLYGSELEKAKIAIDNSFAYKKRLGRGFTLPKTISEMMPTIVPGYVYSDSYKYQVPDVIELDYDFGYLVGAYSACGYMKNRKISIANTNNEYLQPIERICEKWNITQINNIKQSVRRLDNTLLCDILLKLCGNKNISENIVFSNRQCILGFLDAYVGGVGCIHETPTSKGGMKSEGISMVSNSRNMLTDVLVMLKNLGVSGKIRKNLSTYILLVRNQQSCKLASLLNLKIAYKQERVNRLLNETFNFKYKYSKADLYVPDIINGKLHMRCRDNEMMDLEFDQIISIEEVNNTTRYAYDLTVEDTRNFDIYNGLCQRDTFHLAGVASKSNVTRGVPRIEEILRLTPNPKHPSLTVYLKPMDETDQDKATTCATMMEHTKLVDVIRSIEIRFDPNDRATTIEDDQLLLDQYYEFEKLMSECTETTDEMNQTKSKWIVRMVMDAETLLDKNITMDDIHFAIANSQYGSESSCIYSDYNSDKLIFRIRMNSSVFNKTKKRGVAETLDQSDEIYLLKNFQDALMNNIVLRGISNIKNVNARKVQNSVIKEDGKYVRKDTWVLDTTGTNMLEALALDFIDPSRTYSNDIREVFNVLGIEAARQMIYNELSDVMEFSDVYINYHHLSILCDRMTCSKNMVPIFRSGLLKDDVGPIAKATFEVHTEVLLDAARHGELDHMRGVSANVMCGQFGYYGTSAFQLVLDMNEMMTLDNAIISERKDIETEFGLTVEKGDDMCSKMNLQIHNNVANLKTVRETGVCSDDYDAGF